MLLGAAAAWPLAAHAQQAPKKPIVGLLGSTTPSVESQRVAGFVQRLGELGWIEGRNITIEYRWAAGNNERYNEIATEFARLGVDVIVTQGTAAIIAAKKATSVIPIVFRCGKRPGWYRSRRESGAAGRQRYGAVGPGTRSRCQATRIFA